MNDKMIKRSREGAGEEKTMDIKEFSERVCQYVKAALPFELKEAEVYVTRLDIGDGDTRTALLVVRPWDGSATGFCLDDQYAGAATVESAAAAIINDRRLYNMSIQ